MTGEFTVSSHRTSDFYFQSFIRMLKIIGVGIWLPFVVIVFMEQSGVKAVIIALVITVFILVVCAFSAMAERRSRKFESTIILIDQDSVTRKGKDLLTVRISFDKVSRVVERENGIVLVEAGVNSRMIFWFGGRYILSQEPGIIFIPSMMNDFDQINTFFAGEKFKLL